MRAYTKRESEIKIYDAGSSKVVGAIWSPVKSVSGPSEILAFAEGLRITDSKGYFEYQPVSSKTKKRIETSVSHKIEIDDLYLDSAWDERFDSGQPFDIQITDENEDETKEIVTCYRNCTIDSMTKDEGDYTKRGISITAERKEITYLGDTTSLIRTGAAVGKTSVNFSSFYPWSGMRRVALDGSGVIVGIHKSDDTNKWADGSAVDWDIYESSGWNCMVQIPKFYYRREKVGGTWRFEVSEKSTIGFKTHLAFISAQTAKDYCYISAFEGWKDTSNKLRSLPGKQPTGYLTRYQAESYSEANGAGYKNIDWDSLSALQLLWLIEHATMNSQNVYRGVVDLDSGTVNHSQNTGHTLSLGNASGEVEITPENGATGDNPKPFSYRGVENFYGNLWKWISGIDKPENGIYTITGVDYAVEAATGSGYATDFEAAAPGFVPCKISGGSEATYLCDYLYRTTSTNRAVLHGGSWYYGGLAGAFFLTLNGPASNVHRGIGGRAAFL